MLRLLTTTPRFICPVRCINLPRDVKYDHGPSYYIIPEIPSEDAKTAFVDLQSLPKIPEISPDIAFNGFSRLLIDYQLSLSVLSEELRKGNIPITFNSVVHSIEEIFYPIEHAIQLLRSIHIYDGDPVWSIIVPRLYQKSRSSRTEYFHLDPVIYNALLTVKSTDVQLTPTEQELLTAMLDDCWRHGADLALAASSTPISTSSGSSTHTTSSFSSSKNVNSEPLTPSRASTKLDSLRDSLAELEQEESKFLGMVLATAAVGGPDITQDKRTGRYPNLTGMDFLVGAAHIPVAESDLAPSTPVWLPGALGGHQIGGHVADMKVNLALDGIVRELLRHCSTREVRKTVWTCWTHRASVRVFGGSSGQHASNDARMHEIRRLRYSVAQLLGCNDWLELIWRPVHNRSPPSPEWLISEVLEPLREQLQPMGQNELQRLTEWANAHLDLRGGKLEPWDIDYAIEQYNYATRRPEMQSLIKPSTGSVMSHVIHLLDRLAQLFQLRVTCPTEPTTDDGCYTCQITDAQDAQLLGEFILDVFHKPGRTLYLGRIVCTPLTMYTHLHSTGVNVRPKLGEHTMTTLLGNLSSTLVQSEGIKVEDMMSIAGAFGQCLQFVLPRAHYHRPNGLFPCLALDIANLPEVLCESLMFFTILGFPHDRKTDYNHKIFYATSPSVGMRPPPGRITAIPLLRQLYEARFDLSLWSRAERNRSWVVLNDQHWKSHMPYARHPLDSWPTSAVQMFGPNSESGMHYASVWQHMVLRDVLAAVYDHRGAASGEPSAEMLKVLKRFRDVFLTMQDLQPPAELFRRFRGRDPSLEYMLQSLKSRSDSVDALSLTPLPCM